MRLRMRTGLLAVGMVASVTLSGCGGGDPDPAAGLADESVVTYAFHDASVPPAYHRSQTLTVTKDESHLVIDSYGEVLADETAPTSAAAWRALSTSLSSVIGLTIAEPEAGCTGGTGVELTVTGASGDLVDVSPQFCGGSNADVEKAIRSWIAPARDAFPATDVLAPS